jgi:hypothetical protein
LSEIINIILEIFAFVSIFTVKIGVSLLILDLLFYVFFVKTDHSLLQFLEISNVMKAFENVILELLLKALLLIKLLS